MSLFTRAKSVLAIILPVALLSSPGAAPAQQAIQTSDPWIYKGTDIPQDPEWVWGEMPNGLRYAVRRNNVPPGQVSIRVRVDAGSLHEREGEQGFAHLMEHLTFRQSKYLGVAEAIPTWQRLGATFGSDTNAETTPTHTVYKLDIPGITQAKLEESFKLLSGMIREPVLNNANVGTEVPIVLAEKRERGGAGARISDANRELYFQGQLLANRSPIGTDLTLNGANGAALTAFHDRWYRPENTVVVAVGDVDPKELALQVEKWFGDWKGKGVHTPQPDFGKPVAPAGSDPANPVGETRVVVEPGLPRMSNFAILRPYEQVVDNLEYNRGMLIDAVAQAIINRRLESRARTGGSFLYAEVRQDDVSRSADGTFVSVTPLTDDWQAAVRDVRAVIADAVAEPPSQAEIDREVAELNVAFASQVAERSVMAGSNLADTVVQAVDIRESVATPELVLELFSKMKARFTPAAVLEHTRQLFTGDVIRAIMVSPTPVAGGDAALAAVMKEPVKADGSTRKEIKPVSFEKLPPIGKPGTITKTMPIGLLDIEAVEFANGVRALIWPNNAEPGRVSVKVRFGSGYRAFDAGDAVYASIGKMALVSSGQAGLDQGDLENLAVGRKMGYQFDIAETAFRFNADTRAEDLADQLYVFASKLVLPRWDANPVQRMRAAASLQYDSYAAQPDGVVSRDAAWLLSNKDPRYKTPTPADLEKITPEGFRKVWEPLLTQGPVEVMVFGNFDREAGLEALRKTFGALPPRKPIPADALARKVDFPAVGQPPVVLHHSGDDNQAAALIAWPTGGGIANIVESRQLDVLAQIFNDRLFNAMREHAGASYAPNVSSDWPDDRDSGGRITAMAQLQPESVQAFFAAAQKIGAELAAAPPTADELSRVLVPLREQISRASTGNGFWAYYLDGATYEPRKISAIRSLLSDYSQVTPQKVQELAQKYLAGNPGWRMAVLPEGQTLTSAKPAK